MARQPASVSDRATDWPAMPVKPSVTAKGWVRNRCNRRAGDDALVGGAQLVNAQKGDDVLQFGKARQCFAHGAGGGVMRRADQRRIEQG